MGYSCGLKILIEEYKKETGQNYGILTCHTYACTDEFVEWLAKRIETLSIKDDKNGTK